MMKAEYIVAAVQQLLLLAIIKPQYVHRKEYIIAEIALHVLFFLDTFCAVFIRERDFSKL